MGACDQPWRRCSLAPLQADAASGKCPSLSKESVSKPPAQHTLVSLAAVLSLVSPSLLGSCLTITEIPHWSYDALLGEAATPCSCACDSCIQPLFSLIFNEAGASRTVLPGPGASQRLNAGHQLHDSASARSPSARFPTCRAERSSSINWGPVGEHFAESNRASIIQHLPHLLLHPSCCPGLS